LTDCERRIIVNDDFRIDAGSGVAFVDQLLFDL
jgi:hypothetical protein